VIKPKLYEPCNGCGMCCTVKPCMLAQKVLNCMNGPCIAMESDGEKMVCGLIKRPAWYMFGEDRPESETGKLSVLFANALGVGRGCDADDVGRDVWHPVIRLGN
jgi:hypothetical protein